MEGGGAVDLGFSWLYTVEQIGQSVVLQYSLICWQTRAALEEAAAGVTMAMWPHLNHLHHLETGENEVLHLPPF